MDELYLENEGMAGEASSRLFRDWIADDTDDAEPRELAGHLWREGELALLAGESGTGKSIFAVEIADRITKSYESGPLDCTVEPTNVLYVDLEMNTRQLRRRYSYELDAGDTREDYEFTERLFRMQIDPLTMISRGTPEETAKLFVTKIAGEVRKLDAKVVVIDSITALKRTYYGATEILPIIRRLRHLAERRGLSILILATVAQRGSGQPLSLCDLGGLRLAASCVDTVFAIARGGSGGNERYVKHLTSRNSQVVYDRNKVLVYEVGTSGNFLGLEFKGFECETCIIPGKQTSVPPDTELGEIIRLRKEGRSLRHIALMVGRSKSSVGRLLQAYYCRNEPHADKEDSAEVTPPHDASAAAPSTELVSKATEKNEPIDQDQNVSGGFFDDENGRSEGTPKGDEKIVPYDFPGWEKYEAALRDPRLVVTKGMKKDAAKLLKRERSIIQAAAVLANRLYVETGVSIPISDSIRLSEFRRQQGIEFADSS